MANGKFISYFRVSTAKQGVSGLGLEAQQASVNAYLNGGNWTLLQSFTEVESGKKTDLQRPQLAAAIASCKKHKATLIIAKLDRLARNVHFITGLLESGIDFTCADMPEATKPMLQMYSVMAEWERDQISLRTKQALQAAKARGVKLGNPENLKRNIEERQESARAFAEKMRGVLEGMQARKLPQRQMVKELNDLGIKTTRGCCWSVSQLQRTLRYLAD